MDVSFAVADAASVPGLRRAAERYGKLQVHKQSSSYQLCCCLRWASGWLYNFTSARL